MGRWQFRRPDFASISHVRLRLGLSESPVRIGSLFPGSRQARCGMVSTEAVCWPLMVGYVQSTAAHDEQRRICRGMHDSNPEGRLRRRPLPGGVFGWHVHWQGPFGARWGQREPRSGLLGLWPCLDKAPFPSQARVSSPIDDQLVLTSKPSLSGGEPMSSTWTTWPVIHPYRYLGNPYRYLRYIRCP